jgi:hypothetical protein
MKVLIVDDNPVIYQSLIQYCLRFTSSKLETFDLLKKNSFDLIFVNTKFNEDFVNKLREMDAYVPIYLVNLKNDGKGIVEYASLIDGYFINIDQVKEKIEKLFLKNQMYAYAR